MTATILAPEAATFTLTGLSADVFGSCSLLPPPPPPVDPEDPLPSQDEEIYTPIAPGIEYEGLPEVVTTSTEPGQIVIIDTSPDQMVGCIYDTANNAQGRLNALFPGAIAGDGVIERRNNDIWVYDGTEWNNVGPNPGPTIQNLVSVVLPYNETAIYDAQITLSNIVTKFEYALELLTEVDPLSVKISAITTLVRVVNIPPLGIGLGALPPQISISARIEAPTVAAILVGVAPEINTGTAVAVPVTGAINLGALVPALIGRPRTSVFVPAANITLTVTGPVVSTGTSVAVPVSTLTVGSLRPATVGKLDIEAFDLFLLVEDDLLSLRNP
jgi:hypothetical protein